MRNGAEKVAWEHTSSVLCMLAEINRDPKKRKKPFSPSEFNPTIIKDKRDKLIQAPLDVLKLLVPGLKNVRIQFSRD